MWYFIWVLGVGLALFSGILAAIWGEYEETRLGLRAENADDSAR